MQINHQQKRMLKNCLAILVLIAFIIPINSISTHYFARVDMTSDKRYTLSDGSKRIIQQVDPSEQLTIRLYISSHLKEMPPEWKDYGRRVEDLLNEYSLASNGAVKVKVINPKFGSDDEIAANTYGIKRWPLQSLNSIYFGIVIESLDKSKVIPFLSIEKESHLEYTISRAIQNLRKTEKKQIGLMTSLPIMNSEVFSNNRTWRFAQDLESDYELHEFDLNGSLKDKKADNSERFGIPQTIDLLLVIHPKDIDERGMYAIDQYIMGGGKVVICLDPWHEESKVSIISKSQAMPSDLPPLLKKWGIEYDSSTTIADKIYAKSKEVNRLEQIYYNELELNNEAFAKNEISVSSLQKLLFIMPGSFSGTPANGLNKTTLISSSDSAYKVKTDKRFISKDRLEGKATKYDIAIKLDGQFESAYSEIPESVKLEGKIEHRPKSKTATTVILIGDSDFLANKNWSLENKGSQHQGEFSLRNDNNNFIQNIIEQLNGGDDLISIRSRSINLPPFKIVKELENDAGQKFEEALSDIDQQLKDNYRAKKEMLVKISEERNFEKKASLRNELTEMEEFEKQKLEEKKSLRADLHREKEFLKASVLWFNLLFAPLLTAFLGICVWIYRKFN